jgi:hypothetical protein
MVSRRKSSWQESDAMRGSIIAVLAATLLLVFFFVPFVPAAAPCPYRKGGGCPSFAIISGQYGSISYIVFGLGSFGAYPVEDLHNYSGSYAPVNNYLEGWYVLSLCSEGEGWLQLAGQGPWGCLNMVSFHWSV